MLARPQSHRGQDRSRVGVTNARPLALRARDGVQLVQIRDSVRLADSLLVTLFSVIDRMKCGQFVGVLVPWAAATVRAWRRSTDCAECLSTGASTLSRPKVV